MDTIKITDVETYSAAVVIQWICAANTQANLRKLWGELTPYSMNLPGVVEFKDKRKGELK